MDILTEYFLSIKNLDLMKYGEDSNEGLYKLSRIYEEILNKLNIPYEYVFTDDISDGKYETKIEFMNDYTIIVYSKASSSIDIIINNIRIYFEKV